MRGDAVEFHVEIRRELRAPWYVMRKMRLVTVNSDTSAIAD